MQQRSAFDASPVEGAFYYGIYNNASTVPSPVAGGVFAGPGGVSVGRFGWIRPDGRCVNVRENEGDQIGIVIPQWGPAVDWRRVFFDDVSSSWKIREGMNMSVLGNGSVWALFRAGAWPGQRVYANVLDGSAIAGYSPEGQLTRWTVLMPCPPGGLSVITTWSIPV